MTPTMIACTTPFTEQLTLNDDGTRASATESQLQPDGSTVATTSTWTYDDDGRLIGETVIDTGTAATPQGLATSFTLPGDYNLDDGSGISMTWDASANAYLMDGMTPGQIGDTQDAIDTAALLAPSAGVAYGGNGSDWVLVVTNQQSTSAVESFTEANGAFTPDGVQTSGNFGTTPSFTIPTVPGFYSNSYSYDLANNRMQSMHYGPVGGNDETVTYSYNGDDELINQTSSLSGATINSYDANGSLTSSSTGGVVTATYTYDARNKMIGYSAGTTTASYVYDDNGNRVQETINGVMTYYLTDTQNPTGYAQPLEAKSSPTATPGTTYFLGDRVFGQADSSGNVSYLMPDGHGSTEQLANSSGTVTAAFQYDAFGTGLNFTPSSAGTVFLFGGDAVYDPASGLDFHGDGIRPRNGFLFTERDRYAGSPQAPTTLDKYLYVAANPVTFYDPSGYLLDTLGAGAVYAGTVAQDLGSGMSAMGAAGMLVGAIEATSASIAMEIDATNGDTASGSMQYDETVLKKGLTDFNQGLTVATLGLGLTLAGTMLISAGTTALALGGSTALVPVTSWASGPPDLNPGRWVMPGQPNFANYMFSGVWQGASPMDNYISAYVAANRLQYPTGLFDFIKGMILGQRILGP